MPEIIPAIIGENFQEVTEKIEKVKGLSNWVQIDIVDGKFAEPQSWGAKISDHLHLWEPEELPKIELHLMVEKPEVALDDWISTSVDRILIHHESQGDKKKLFQKIKAGGAETGLVLNMATPISVVNEFISDVDVVQLMSIGTIGSYGAPFDEQVLVKIQDLKKAHPGVTISVDGGINEETAPRAVEAGAENLVIGSAIFKRDNIEESISGFKKLS